MLTEEEDIQRMWKEYFESVLTGNPDDRDSATFFIEKMETYS
jgi:hypothetical protein